VTADLDALRAALPSGLVALDFDGTLAPVSPLPGDARPVDGAGPLLRDVRATGATLAVVTGRSVASLLRVSGFDAIPGIVIYGTHGAQRWQAGQLRAPAAGLGVRPGREVLEICIPGLDKGTALAELLSDDPAAAFYAGDDLGDLPAIGAVNAWAGRTGRPALTVGVSASGRGPVAGQAGLTVPDPHSLMPLLRQLLPVPAPAANPLI
jgi:trehalose 6-phosphate phosphatase